MTLETKFKAGTLIETKKKFYYYHGHRNTADFLWASGGEIYMVVEEFEKGIDRITLTLLSSTTQKVVYAPFISSEALDNYFTVLQAPKRTSQKKRPRSR